MRTIKAAVAHAFGEKLCIQEVNLAAPKPNELEVTLEACAICHSDITYLDGKWGGSLPAVYGMKQPDAFQQLENRFQDSTLGIQLL